MTSGRSAQCRMGFTVTSSSRRVVMTTLVGLAVCGGFIRYLAPDPSTLRDVGSLLLVLWLPAVGNLVAYFIRKIPQRAPPTRSFAPDAPFAPQLKLQLEVSGIPGELLAALDGTERACTVIAGRRGFTARVGEPLVRTFGTRGPLRVELELLHRAAAVPHLQPGTHVAVLVGRTGVAKGVVLAA